MTHAEAIRHGEVWRTITALTLHADGLHLVSNLLFGGLFGLFAGQILGSGVAWLSILLAGGAGNLLNAWIREPQHTSIGASTAVFATLGMVAALSWSRRMPGRRSWMLRLAPLIGAAVLLSFLGTGGERTDVLAHVTGFTSGAALGAIESRLSDRIRRSRIFQCILGFAAIGLLVVSWAVALRSA
ncbi:MAG: rhomboid family intramembrane serine protease [Phycisphaerae bacterium]|nr:rhomboid family intramembrane serine protease [Phycisphaerae bacterium]